VLLEPGQTLPQFLAHCSEDLDDLRQNVDEVTLPRVEPKVVLTTGLYLLFACFLDCLFLSFDHIVGHVFLNDDVAIDAELLLESVHLLESAHFFENFHVISLRLLYRFRI